MDNVTSVLQESHGDVESADHGDENMTSVIQEHTVDNVRSMTLLNSLKKRLQKNRTERYKQRTSTVQTEFMEGRRTTVPVLRSAETLVDPVVKERDPQETVQNDQRLVKACASVVNSVLYEEMKPGGADKLISALLGKPVDGEFPFNTLFVLQGTRDRIYPVPCFCRPPYHLFINDHNPLLTAGLCLSGNVWLDSLDAATKPSLASPSQSPSDMLLLSVQDVDTFLQLINGQALPTTKSPTFVGRLAAMCSLDEMIEKQKTSTANDFERLPATLHGDEEARLVNRYLVTKSFQRSDANKVFREADVRSLVWCRKTIHNLLALHLDADCTSRAWHIDRGDSLPRIAIPLDVWTSLGKSKQCGSSTRGCGLSAQNRFKFLDVYNFLRDRFRSVWQDLTVQHCAKHRAFIESLEISFRFLLLSEELLCEEKSFNAVQNADLMNTCLDKLMGGYADSRYSLPTLQSRLPVNTTEVQRLVFSVLAYSSPHEAEFWAYRIIMTLRHSLENSNAMLDVYRRMPVSLRQHAYVSLAIAAHRAFRERNACRYFKILRQADYLLSTLLYKFAGLVRVAYLEVLVSRSSRQRQRMPFKSFCEQFGEDDGQLKRVLCGHCGFSGEDATNIVAFCEHYRLRLSPERDPLLTPYAEWTIEYVYFSHAETISAADLQFKRLKCRHFRSAYLMRKWNTLQLCRQTVVDPDFPKECVVVDYRELKDASLAVNPLPLCEQTHTVAPASQAASQVNPDTKDANWSSASPAFEAGSVVPLLSSFTSTPHGPPLYSTSTMGTYDATTTAMLTPVLHGSAVHTNSTTTTEASGPSCIHSPCETNATSVEDVKKHVSRPITVTPTQHAADPGLGGSSFAVVQDVSRIMMGNGGGASGVNVEEDAPLGLTRTVVKRQHGDPVTPASLAQDRVPVTVSMTASPGHAANKEVSVPPCSADPVSPHGSYDVDPVKWSPEPDALALGRSYNIVSTLCEQEHVDVQRSHQNNTPYLLLSNDARGIESLHDILHEGVHHMTWTITVTCAGVIKDSTQHNVGVTNGSFGCDSWRPAPSRHRVEEDPQPKGSPRLTAQNSFLESHSYVSHILPKLLELLFYRLGGCSSPKASSGELSWTTAVPCCSPQLTHALWRLSTADGDHCDLCSWMASQALHGLWSSLDVTQPSWCNGNDSPSESPGCIVRFQWLMPYNVMPLGGYTGQPHMGAPSAIGRVARPRNVRSRRKTLATASCKSSTTPCAYKDFQLMLGRFSESHVIWIVPYPVVYAHSGGAEQNKHAPLLFSTWTAQLRQLVHALVFKLALQKDAFHEYGDLCVSLFYGIHMSPYAFEKYTSIAKDVVGAAWKNIVVEVQRTLCCGVHQSVLAALSRVQVYTYCVFEVYTMNDAESSTDCVRVVDTEVRRALRRLSDVTTAALRSCMEPKLPKDLGGKARCDALRCVYLMKGSWEQTQDASLSTKQAVPQIPDKALKIAVVPPFFRIQWKEVCVESLPLLMVRTWKAHVAREGALRDVPTVNDLAQVLVTALGTLTTSRFLDKFFWNDVPTHQYSVHSRTSVPIILSERHVVKSLLHWLASRCEKGFVSRSAINEDNVGVAHAALKDFHSVADFMTAVRDAIRYLIDFTMAPMKDNIVWVLPFPFYRELVGSHGSPWHGLPFPPQFYNGAWTLPTVVKDMGPNVGHVESSGHPTADASVSPCNSVWNWPLITPQESLCSLHVETACPSSSSLSRSRQRQWSGSRTSVASPVAPYCVYSLHSDSANSFTSYSDPQYKLPDHIVSTTINNPTGASSLPSGPRHDLVTVLKERLSNTFKKLKTEMLQNYVSLNTVTQCWSGNSF